MENTEIKKEVICLYWIVQCDHDREKLERHFGRKIADVGHRYPYEIGKEGGHIFQNPGTEKLKDFFDEDEGVLYKYTLESLVSL